MTPGQRAAWNAYVAGCRAILTCEPDDVPLNHFVVASTDHIVAADDLIVALEAQVAEARRLLAQYVTPFDPQRGATDCLSCGGDVSTGMFEDFWTAHTEDCPVGAFLAATAPHDGAGEATG